MLRAIKQDRLVTGIGDQVFPGVIAQPWGLDQDDPGAEAVEVHAAQDDFFVAFDVDLRKWIRRSAACCSQSEVSVRASTVKLCTVMPRSLRCWATTRSAVDRPVCGMP